MNLGNHNAALRYFYRCDELSRTLDKDGASGFMVLANLKVGNIYDLLAQRDQALAQYKKVLKMKEFRDSHAQAELFIKNPFAK
jgi:hypothetical protein